MAAFTIASLAEVPAGGGYIVTSYLYRDMLHKILLTDSKIR